MQSTPMLDRAGRRRSPATTSGFHEGRAPRNKGLRYPPDPPPVEEIVAVMRAAGDTPEGLRLRAIIVVLWRAGLRISEALALNETDLDPSRGFLVVRHGKGDKRREVGMDRWAWTHLDPWLELRRELPVGRSSASCAARRAGGHALRPESALNCTTPPRQPGSDAGSRRTSSDTPTRWRCHARVSPCS
jgi:integrase